MFYVTVRIILCVIIFAICLFIANKSKLQKKKVLKSAIVIVCLALCIAFNFIPFENLFVTFPTAQSSYKYTSSGDADIIINGEETDLVISDKDNGNNNVLIIPKTKDGWKIGRAVDTKLTAYKNSNGVSIRVYQYKDSQDFYVVLTDINNNLKSVSDSINSKFESREIINSSNDLYYEYFAYVNNLDENYSLKFNEKIVYINQECTVDG